MNGAVHGPRRSSASALIALAIALVPPVLVAIVIAEYVVNVPYRDHWTFAPEVLEFWSGRYRLVKLWQPSGQHRIVVPKLVMLALLPWTRWDVRVETWVSFAASLASLGLLVDLARRSLRPFAPRLWVWTVPLMSAAIFSLAAWHSWTFGWMVNVYLAILGLVLVAWALGAFGTSARGIALMFVGATIAAYSYLSGVLLWALVPVAVAVFPAEESEPGRSRFGRTSVAAVAALALIGVYFIGYPTSSVAGVVAHASPDPSALVAFVTRFLGAPLSAREASEALAWGTMGLVLALMSSVVTWTRDAEHRRALLPWLLLVCFAVANAAATASGRFAGRPQLALYSRYAMVASPFWAALPACVVLAMSAARVAHRQLWLRRLAAVSIGLLLLLAARGWVETNYRGVEATAARRASLEAASRCLHDVRQASDRCLQRVSKKNFRLVRRVVPGLARLGLGPFIGSGATERDPDAIAGSSSEVGAGSEPSAESEAGSEAGEE